MTLRTLYFSFAGRIGRKTYWLAFLGYIGVIVTLLLAFRVANDHFLHAYLPPGWSATIGFLLLPLLPVTVKRLHDTDRSARVIIVLLAYFYFAMAVDRLFYLAIESKPLINVNDPREVYFLWFPLIGVLVHALPAAFAVPVWGQTAKVIASLQQGYYDMVAVSYLSSAVVALIGLCASVWYLWLVGFRRGTVGPNRYGPDPLT